MSAMPVPPQITSLVETAKDSAGKQPQWYEESPTTETAKPEKVVLDQELTSITPETAPTETTNTLITSEKPAAVVDETQKLEDQPITTLVGADEITSLADDTENKVIGEINAAHAEPK
jgi:hypothetical protein